MEETPRKRGRERAAMLDMSAYAQALLKEDSPCGNRWVTEGCIGLYSATGERQYREMVLREAEKGVSGAAGEGRSLMSLLFALDETGETCYETAAKEQMHHLLARVLCQEPMTPQELYRAAPFLLACETRFDRMAHTGDVTGRLRMERACLYDGEAALYRAGADLQEPSLRAEGMVLAALADCVALCSEELYEHWRALVDWLREAARGLMPFQDRDSGLFRLPGEDGDRAGNALAVYALLKAVRLGVLDPERYVPLGRRAFERLAQDLPEDGAEEAGPLLMAWAEYLRLEQKESEAKRDGAV